MILCAKIYFVKKVGSMLVVVFESGFFVLNIDRFFAVMLLKLFASVLRTMNDIVNDVCGVDC